MAFKKIKRLEYLGQNKEINNATNACRSSINKYRNAEGISHWNTFYKHVDLEDKTSIDSPWLKEEDTRAPPEIVTDMNENIAIYINRSMQHLKELMYEKEPTPKNTKDFYKFISMVQMQEPFRKQDVMLYSSNVLVLVNSLDANIYKQVASTIYNKYDQTADETKMTVKQLEERIAVDYPKIHGVLFNNGLGEAKKILKSLRNTAGHSDIERKIVYEGTGNPFIWINREPKDLYSQLHELGIAYLDKARRVYDELARTTLENSNSSEFFLRIINKIQ